MASGKTGFNRLDAFTKTVEDARIRTTSGGVVTIVSLVLILYLMWGEWVDYRRVTVLPQLVVDKSRGDKMEIHMNITFPHMPCELLTLDVMDVSGDVQTSVLHGITRTRLKPESEGGGVISSQALDLHANSPAPAMAADYCGSCYGAEAPSTAKKAGCCNTCDEVRDAYAEKSWSFGTGDNIEQCQREHFSEHIKEQIREGCRIDGGIRVNKVVGNFHFAPGKPLYQNNMHLHDLQIFRESTEAHSFSHIIHHLRFGPVLPDEVKQKFGGKDGMAWTNHHLNPLDETRQDVTERFVNFMYFIKVVPTSYLTLGWEKSAPSSLFAGHGDMAHELVELGKLGYSESGSVETHQYSVTSHKRELHGGDAKDEGHAERWHAFGGIPGVFFSFDISPLKVINREERNKSFSAFLFGVCAVIGGTLTVAAAIDRALYEGGRKMNKVKDR